MQGFVINSISFTFKPSKIRFHAAKTVYVSVSFCKNRRQKTSEVKYFTEIDVKWELELLEHVYVCLETFF